MQTTSSAGAVLALVATVSVGVSAPAGAGGPQGHLVAIGGGPRPASIMQLIACLAGGPDGKMLIFPQASELEDTGALLEAEFTALGLGEVVVVGVDRTGADTDATLALTNGATGVYFSGGDQNRLVAVLAGTKLGERLHALYRSGAVIAGTSAGAAVMSRVMITGDERRPFSADDAWQTIEKDNVVTAVGLGFIDDAIVDQHFVRRKRHNRLLSLVMEHPSLVGLAVDEATAAWILPGRILEVVGDGPLLVFDAGGASIAGDATGPGLRSSDLRLHVLRHGSRYDLAERAVVDLAVSVNEAPRQACAPR